MTKTHNNDILSPNFDFLSKKFWDKKSKFVIIDFSCHFLGHTYVFPLKRGRNGFPQQQQQKKKEKQRSHMQITATILQYIYCNYLK